MRFSFLPLFLGMLIGLDVYGQDFQLIKYRVKDGLPTDVVKSVTEDSLGFLWVATDEGLSKFDGTRFTHYRDALHSQYSKAFLNARSGKIYLIGDLDLVEIMSRVDTAIIKTVRNGTRNPTDSTMWYPKSIYETRTGDIWIGEPQSVVRVKGTSLQRFAFGSEEQTPEFLRSFAFFEDQKGSFFCVSYFGRIYQFDADASVFNKLSQSFPTDIKDIEIVNGTIWIVAGDGIYTAGLNAAGGFSSPKRKFVVENPSCIKLIQGGRALVGTNTKNQYLVDLDRELLTPIPGEINDVNSVFVGKNNDIWLASSDGLVLLQENLFKSIQFEDQATFIESIAEDSVNQTIYYTSILNLFSSKLEGGIAKDHKVILNVPRGYFQAMQLSKNGLWASNRYSVFLLKNEKLYKTWDFEKEGRFVFDLFLDSRENLWMSQDGNRKVLCMTSDLTLKRYSIPLDKESNVNAIREDATGLLAASVGIKSYLFHKAHGDTVFRNISVPVGFPIHGDFNITDLAFSNGVVWLASTEGLLKYDYRTIERIKLDGFNSELAVRTVETLGDGEILFNNSLGLVRYQVATGDWWLYNEGDGLPANTIATRGIFVGSKKKVWVGTSLGLSYANSSIIINQKSTTPLFVRATVNGRRQMGESGLYIPFGSFLNLTLSSNTYPQSKVNLQFRFVGPGQQWQSVLDGQLNISDLPPGRYEIEIRAKRTGGYNWSDTRSMTFIVEKPFWQTSWFIGFVMATFVLVGWASYQTARRVNRKRRTELEKLLAEVKERNEEIQAQSEELTESNQSLNRLYVEVAEQKEELQTLTEELMEANQAQTKLYQALAEKNEEIQAQSEELTESNETISQLNKDLEKRVEEKSKDLLRTNEELSKYNSDLLQFSYSVSHNLRGPVARLLGLSHIMAGVGSADELKKMAEMVHNSSLELDTVLKDLTNIIDMRNNISHIREKVFIEDEWKRSCSMLQDQLKDEYRISVDFSGAPVIYTVRPLLQSILYNLLSNAIKYRSPDRPLSLQVRSGSVDNDTFIEIKDNGLGFDLNSQGDKIFKLYKRFHTHVPGRGLGLYLVKTQTELLNGTISIESEINKGTTFRLNFPTPESIERQVFLDNETAILYYDANINNTVIIWKREITPGSYRLIFETILKTLTTYNSPGWIADLRNQGVVRAEEQSWFSNSVLPEALKSGLKRIAAVGFADPKRQAYYKLMMARSQELGFELQVFDTLEAATEWMRDSLRRSPRVEAK